LGGFEMGFGAFKDTPRQIEVNLIEFENGKIVKMELWEKLNFEI
jgi:hypothetical protein